MIVVWSPRIGPLAALAALAALPGAASAQARPDRHIHGVVEDSASGAPLAGAEVTIPDLGRRTRAHSDGHFDLRGLPSERVELHVRLVGFRPVRRTVDLTTGDGLVKLLLVAEAVELPEVAVLGDTGTAPLARTLASSELRGTDLDRQRGQTLGETLRDLPGVALMQMGPSISKPVIRGLNSQRVLVMHDGVRQEDQQWGREHAPTIDGFDLDVVTVERGAAAVLYGPDILGGVVRVERAPLPAAGGWRADLAVNTFTNNRQGAASLRLETGDADLPLLGPSALRLRLTGRLAGNAAAPAYQLGNTGFRELNGSLEWGIARDWGRLEVATSRFATELGVLRDAHVGNLDDLLRAMGGDPLPATFTYGISRPNQRVQHYALRARATLPTGAGGEVRVTYGVQANDRREYDNHGPLRNRDIPAFHLRLFTNSLDARWSHASDGRLRGSVGVSGSVQGNQTLGKAFVIPGYDMVQGGLYAQETLDLGRVTVTAGARVDAIVQSSLDFSDFGIRSPATTRRWGDLAGSLGAAWEFVDGWSVALRVARAWRAPNVNERFAQGVHHGAAQYELGDPAIGRERSLGLETTFRHDGRRLRAELAAYRNRIDGFIYLRPRDPIQTIRGAFPGFEYVQAPARLQGVELAADWTPLDWLQVVAVGSVVRGDDRATALPLWDMPADRAALDVRWRGGAGGTSRWVGVGTTLVRRQDRVPPGSVYSFPTEGYALAHLEAGLQGVRLLGGAPVDVSLRASNLLDRRYRDFLSRYRLFADDPGRDVALRVRMPLW